jgi:hypothetical protein
MSSSQSPDRLVMALDDDHAVANAGLVLPATLTRRLGIEAVVDQMVDLGDRPGAYRPGRKVLTLVHALVAGADAIDDVDMLGTGSTAAVLGHRVMAPSTLGTLLRCSPSGMSASWIGWPRPCPARAWAAEAGPGTGPLRIDVDSTVCEVHGDAKQGAAFGYTRQLGYHSLLASRADTGEVVHIRMRSGRAASGRGAELLDHGRPDRHRQGSDRGDQ